MPKLGMEPIRRQQLIEATIASISEHGFADATVARISKAAGVSAGIIHHYFGGKNELFEATMRSLLRELHVEVARRMAGAPGPRARIEAIVDGNFSERQFEPTAVTAWLAFWAQVPHVPALARLQAVNARRLQSNLRHSLRTLLPADAAEEAAFGMAALIDGLWLRAALTGTPDIERARATARGYLARLLATRPSAEHEHQTTEETTP